MRCYLWQEKKSIESVAENHYFAQDPLDPDKVGTRDIYLVESREFLVYILSSSSDFVSRTGRAAAPYRPQEHPTGLFTCSL